MSQGKFTNRYYEDVIDFLRRLIHNDLYINRFKKEITQMLNTRDVEELKSRIQAMTDEELEIVVENIPVDMCLKRISDEINRGNAFRRYIDDAMRLSDGGCGRNLDA